MTRIVLYVVAVVVLAVIAHAWRSWHRAKAVWRKHSAGTRNIAFTVMETR